MGENEEDEDICGLCGRPGADKLRHPCHWPTEANPNTPYVHADCEQEETKRAYQEYLSKVGEEGIRAFLRL